MRGQANNLLVDVAKYYTEKLAAYGDTPAGVDWNDEESQNLRFEQLCKIIDPKTPSFSLNDLGCGYGAQLDYLRDKYGTCSYLGVDISHEMIKAAERRHYEPSELVSLPRRNQTKWLTIAWRVVSLMCAWVDQMQSGFII
jgi:SAM-dependent methyltransferase